MAVEWLRGAELHELAEAHLGAVADEDFRYEQLSEFVTQVLEHLLPWTLSTLITWLNAGREELDQLCPQLSAYMRYGVSSAVALELAEAGVRSRRLLQVVSAKAASLGFSGDGLIVWLGAMDVPTWRSEFDATPSELADLIVVTRVRDARLT